MVLNKTELINLLTEHGISPNRYQFENSIIAYHNGKIYPMVLKLQFDHWNIVGQPINDDTLIPNFIKNFDNPCEKVYIYYPKDKLSLFSYHSVNIIDDKLVRLNKIKNLIK